MRIGIIIVFHNNEKDIDTSFFIKHFNQDKNIDLCLVNNASKDNTYELLKEIKNGLSQASLIDIKRFKSDVAAVRSGARFMFNKFDLNHLGYISTNLIDVKSTSLNDTIRAIRKNQNIILRHIANFINKKQTKLTLFQSVFSVIEYLEKLKPANKHIGYE